MLKFWGFFNCSVFYYLDCWAMKIWELKNNPNLEMFPSYETTSLLWGESLLGNHFITFTGHQKSSLHLLTDVYECGQLKQLNYPKNATDCKLVAEQRCLCAQCHACLSKTDHSWGITMLPKLYWGWQRVLRPAGLAGGMPRVFPGFLKLRKKSPVGWMPRKWKMSIASNDNFVSSQLTNIEFNKEQLSSIQAIPALN